MEGILLSGGAAAAAGASSAVGTASLLVPPLDPSSLKCKLFGCKEEERSSGPPNLPHYSDQVLIGNWFEKRVVYHSPPDQWLTLYNTHYKPYDAKLYEEDIFTVWKNKQKIQGTGGKLVSDGDPYLNNMTSSYDLSYRILPKDLCGPRIRVYNPKKKAWLPQTELALSVGNQTKYGLVEAIKEEGRLAESIPPWQSIYQVDYIKQPVEAQDFSRTRFPQPRAKLNDPDLRHLGIILSPTTKLTAREPQYRPSQRGKICASL